MPHPHPAASTHPDKSEVLKRNRGVRELKKQTDVEKQEQRQTETDRSMQVQAYLLLQDLLIVVWYSHEFSGIGSELIGAHRFGHWVWRLQV